PPPSPPPPPPPPAPPCPAPGRAAPPLAARPSPANPRLAAPSPLEGPRGGRPVRPGRGRGNPCGQLRAGGLALARGPVRRRAVSHGRGPAPPRRLPPLVAGRPHHPADGGTDGATHREFPAGGGFPEALPAPARLGRPFHPGVPPAPRRTRRDGRRQGTVPGQGRAGRPGRGPDPGSPGERVHA